MDVHKGRRRPAPKTRHDNNTAAGQLEPWAREYPRLGGSRQKESSFGASTPGSRVKPGMTEKVARITETWPGMTEAWLG